MDTNKHKFFMLQILKDIFADKLLSKVLGFKGGTCLMFFYGLPRFSVDLDFNLLDKTYEKEVFNRVKAIISKYGKIHDEAIKYYGPIVVLDYGVGERKLKVEISNRIYPNRYEIKNLLGIDMRIMTMPDMFAHKLCALLDRTEVSGRDIFDCWFFLNLQTAVNSEIIKERTGNSLEVHLQQCIDELGSLSDNAIMRGIGDLTDSKMKTFVKTKLRKELIQMLEFFKTFPIVDNYAR